eukprot:COSAG04_NODE_2335_length_4307_cov_3.183416_7_plen_66_part_00
MASKEEIAAMKKEASDLEAKVEKMMMEKVRALFFSAPPFLRLQQSSGRSAAGIDCGALYKASLCC